MNIEEFKKQVMELARDNASARDIPALDDLAKQLRKVCGDTNWIRYTCPFEQGVPEGHKPAPDDRPLADRLDNPYLYGFWIHETDDRRLVAVPAFSSVMSNSVDASVHTLETLGFRVRNAALFRRLSLEDGSSTDLYLCYRLYVNQSDDDAPDYRVVDLCPVPPVRDDEIYRLSVAWSDDDNAPLELEFAGCEADYCRAHGVKFAPFEESIV